MPVVDDGQFSVFATNGLVSFHLECDLLWVGTDFVSASPTGVGDVSVSLRRKPSYSCHVFTGTAEFIAGALIFRGEL